MKEFFMQKGTDVEFKSLLTETEYNKHLKGTWWMTAEDAHKLRICNEVLLAYQNIR